MNVAVQSLETDLEDLGVSVETFAEASMGATRPVGDEAERLLQKTAPETASTPSQIVEIHGLLHIIDGAEACRDVALYGVRDGSLPRPRPRPPADAAESADQLTPQELIIRQELQGKVSLPPVVSPSGRRPDLIEAARPRSSAQRLGDGLERSLASTDQRMANAARAQATAMAAAPPPHPALTALERLRVSRAIEQEALAQQTAAAALAQPESSPGRLERLRTWFRGGDSA